MLPRRSSRVWSLTADLVKRNKAQGKTDRHRSMVEASRGIDRIVQIEPQVLVDVQWAGDANQCLGEIGIDTPVPALVRVGEGGSGDVSSDAHVVQLVFLSTQARFDIAQTLAEGELRKGHAEVLVETGEGLRVTVAVVARHTAPEGVNRQMVDDLRENEPAGVHDGASKTLETGYFEDSRGDLNR